MEGDTLEILFDKYHYLNNNFKQKLLSMGFTLEKLLNMSSYEITSLSKMDKSMTADLLLLNTAINSYKSDHKLNRTNTIELNTTNQSKNHKYEPIPQQQNNNNYNESLTTSNQTINGINNGNTINYNMYTSEFEDDKKIICPNHLNTFKKYNKIINK